MKVRDVLRLIEEDGWRFRSQKGSHRQFVHASKKGRVTVAGRPSQEMHVKTLGDVFRQAQIEKPKKVRFLMKYAIVIEKVPGSNYSAYVPDLPGCVATGETLEEVKRLMKEGIEFHLEGMREDGDAIPEPLTEVSYAEVA